MVIRDENGQSIVEYIMLLGVVLLLVLTVLKNDRFREMMGPNSTIVNGMRDSMMYSYRHGRPGLSSNDTSNNDSAHDTYSKSGGSESRFFSGNDPYPAGP